MSTHWYIDATNGEMIDIGADSMEIHPSGALVFTIGREMVAYPAGSWRAVHSEVED